MALAEIKLDQLEVCFRIPEMSSTLFRGLNKENVKSVTDWLPEPKYLLLSQGSVGRSSGGCW